jgi:hypothetical protein
MPSKSPAALAQAKLAESGLTGNDAKILKMQALPSGAVTKLDASFKPYPALRIPYFDLKGKPDGFYRLRYLGDLNGFDALRSKQIRYVQPAESPPGVYLPPFGDWKSLAQDPGRPIFITEGELKAACACKLAIPTIGLGGVWSWKSTKRSISFHPVLDEFSWKGRMTYIVFDSDFSSNPDVMKALIALSKELGARGAQPYLVSLPELPELLEKGKKTGLDDYLVLRGKFEFESLVAAASPFSQAQELWELNSEVVYIKDPGLVVVLADGRKLSAGAFKEHAYANRHFYETKFNAKGEQRQEKKPLAPAWLQWEQRSELERITFLPGKERIVDNCYNYWPGWGCEPRRGDVSLWKQLLDHLFQGDVAARRYFEQWLAYPLQHPGAKLYAAAVMWGPTAGTGKSLIGYSVSKIYGKNFTEISDKDLSGSFNEWAENKQFIMGDDVTSAEYKRALMEELKFMITRQYLRINAKYLPTYTLPDCINWYFTSNSPDAFIVEDTDRRYFVWEAPPVPLPEEFYKRYDKILHDPALAFSSALFWHLLHVDLAGFNPKGHAMSTEAKRAMQLDSKTDVGLWVAELKESPDSVLRLGEMELKSDLYTATQLMQLYDPQNQKRMNPVWMGKELKRAGITQVNNGSVVLTAKGPQRLYAVRNATRWMKAKHKDQSDHWNKFFARAEIGKEKKA